MMSKVVVIRKASTCEFSEILKVIQNNGSILFQIAWRLMETLYRVITPLSIKKTYELEKKVQIKVNADRKC